MAFPFPRRLRLPTTSRRENYAAISLGAALLHIAGFPSRPAGPISVRTIFLILFLKRSPTLASYPRMLNRAEHQPRNPGKNPERGLPGALGKAGARALRGRRPAGPVPSRTHLPSSGAGAARRPTSPAVTSQKPSRPSTTNGARWKSCRRSRPSCRSSGRERSSRATSRPTFLSTARSIPIAAASMAASTASRGRPTPISGCRPGSISNRSCSQARRRGAPGEGAAKPGYQPRTIAIGTNTDPYQPIERDGGSAPDPRGAVDGEPSGRHRHQVGAGGARHRTWRRWPSAGSPRWRSR